MQGMTDSTRSGGLTGLEDKGVKGKSQVLCLGGARPAEAKLLVQSHMLLI